jgi:hypothetical protein
VFLALSGLFIKKVSLLPIANLVEGWSLQQTQPFARMDDTAGVGQNLFAFSSEFLPHVLMCFQSS